MNSLPFFQLEQELETLLKECHGTQIEPALKQKFLEYMNFIHQEVFLGKRSKNLDKQLALLSFVFSEFISTREERIADIESPEVTQALKIKEHLFPLGTPKLSLCVDGRVLSKLFAGLHGSASRTPAGENPEFLPTRDGCYTLSPNSTFAQMVFRSLDGRNVNTQVWDSHAGCAARKQAETERNFGEAPQDDGLYADVILKSKHKEALDRLIENTYNGTKHVVHIQTSFDPHNGDFIMGLEKEENINDEEAKQIGYTHDVLHRLAHENKVISTKNLIETEEKIQEIFHKYQFALDYENTYRESTLAFWKNIDEMKDEILPIIKRRLIIVFPHLANPKNVEELQQRATLLIANAYNISLFQDHWPYADHDESIVVVTRSEKGPFRSARAFSISSDDPNKSAVIAFTADLIRKNRLAGRIPKNEKLAMEKYFENVNEYMKSAVPLAFFERIYSPVTPELIEKIRKATWTDLPDSNWIEMTENEFFAYLDKKIPFIPYVAAEAINRLRLEAKKLYIPGKPATKSFLEGRIIPLCALATSDRANITFIPFMLRGYPLHHHHVR